MRARDAVAVANSGKTLPNQVRYAALMLALGRRARFDAMSNSRGTVATTGPFWLFWGTEDAVDAEASPGAADASRLSSFVASIFPETRGLLWSLLGEASIDQNVSTEPQALL
jgi:hypothetical protein